MAVTEPKRLHHVLHWEADAQFSREKIVLLSGQNLTVGAVLGRKLVSPTVSGAAASGNTGNGTISGVGVGTNGGARRGVYKAVCVEPGLNGGSFAVYGPDGVFLGKAVVGTAFDNEVAFTINDGATDFVPGDSFIITVSGGSYKYKLYDPANTDGSQVAVGVLAYDTDASGGDKETVAIVRYAVLKTNGLVWFTGATADQKLAALDQLARSGIIVRNDI